MADVKIRNLPTALEITGTDLFIIEQNSGTCAIPYATLFNGFATESYVSSALSNYVTKSYLSNVLTSYPTSSHMYAYVLSALSGYATETYVQNYVNNLDAREEEY